MTVLEVRDLDVRYGEVHALDSVSIDAGPGLTVLVGVNGSGKSSLLAAIAGAVPPAHGTITVDGAPVALARQAGHVAYVPQLDAIDRDFPITVSQVVAMGCYASNEPKTTRRSRVARAINQVGLDGLEKRQIGELSGGQRRRVLIARALAQQAQVYVLDEPDAGVDPAAREVLYRVLRELTQAGRTVIMATHDLSSVPDNADHAIVMQRRVIAAGPPAQVLTPVVLARAFGGGE